MKMHYSHGMTPSRKEKIVGLFILVPLLILSTVFYFIGRNQYLFEEKYSIRAVFPEAEGLKPGTQVLLSGITIGSVVSVQLNEQNKVEAILKIRKRFQEKITQNSKARAAKTGFIGELSVKIIPGKPSDYFLTDGEEIPVEQPVTIAQLIPHVKPILENAERIVTRLSDIIEKVPLEALGESVEQVRSITSKIGSKEGTIGSLIADKKIYQDMRATAAKTQNVVDSLEKILKKAEIASERLPEIMEKTDTATGDISEIIKKIEPKITHLLDNLSANLSQIKEVTTGLPELIDTTKEVIENMKEGSETVPLLVEAVQKMVHDINERIPMILDQMERIMGNVERGTADIPEITEDTHEVIKGAKKMWPIKNYIPEEKETDMPRGGRGSHE